MASAEHLRYLLLGTGQHLSLEDICILPVDGLSSITSRYRDITINNVNNKTCLPIFTAPMPSILSSQFIHKIKTHSSVDIQGTIFPREDFGENEVKSYLFDKTQPLWPNGCAYKAWTDIYKIEDEVKAYNLSYVLIDTANGHSRDLLSYMKNLYEMYLPAAVIAGNVVCPDAAVELGRYCDYLRVGIGGGTACTTSQNTGIAYGMVNALLEIREAFASKKISCKLIADGGIRTTGDINKALALGADAVMLGSMFARCPESRAEWVTKDDKDYKKYEGLASSQYNKTTSIEGDIGFLPLGDSVETLISRIDGNLRSAMSYVGASNLEEFRQHAHFGILGNNASKNLGSRFEGF